LPEVGLNVICGVTVKLVKASIVPPVGISAHTWYVFLATDVTVRVVPEGIAPVSVVVTEK